MKIEYTGNFFSNTSIHFLSLRRTKKFFIADVRETKILLLLFLVLYIHSFFRGNFESRVNVCITYRRVRKTTTISRVYRTLYSFAACVKQKLRKQFNQRQKMRELITKAFFFPAYIYIQLKRKANAISTQFSLFRLRDKSASFYPFEKPECAQRDASLCNHQTMRARRKQKQKKENAVREKIIFAAARNGFCYRKLEARCQFAITIQTHTYMFCEKKTEMMVSVFFEYWYIKAKITKKVFLTDVENQNTTVFNIMLLFF